MNGYAPQNVKVLDDSISQIAGFIAQAEGEMRGQLSQNIAHMMSWQSSWKGAGGTAALAAIETYRAQASRLFSLMNEYVTRLKSGNAQIQESDAQARAGMNVAAQDLESISIANILGG